MSTTADLEARIKELETKVDDLTKEVMEGKVDSLRARLDELEVQMNLGGKDVRDQIAPLLDQFGGRITEIRGMADVAAGQAGDALTGLADNLRSAAGDLRTRMDQAAARFRPGGGSEG